MTGPSARQYDVLRLIARHYATLGYGPSVRELARALRVSSTNAGSDLLLALETKGLVVSQVNRCRTLQLTPEGAVYASAGSVGATAPSTPQPAASPRSPTGVVVLAHRCGVCGFESFPPGRCHCEAAWAAPFRPVRHRRAV